MPPIPLHAHWMVRDRARIATEQHPHLKGLPVSRYERAGLLLAAELMDLRAALEIAERFMSGFEDDELQDGINDKLAAIRAALQGKDWRL
jgi:hypothetical protein